MLNGYDEYECDCCGQQFDAASMVLGVQDLCDECQDLESLFDPRNSED